MVNDKVNDRANVMVNHLLEACEAKIQAIGVLNSGFSLHNIVFC
jgi:hypothetical protein